ncbi:MAG: hypothetical protein LQ346_004816 [Caloplaca aetnensis]|nr:MAG: hypothetical protein LQ346_004816 [Caloplaca aetnensis]
MDTISQPLSIAPGPITQGNLLAVFWGEGAYDRLVDVAQCEDYFEYYNLQARRLDLWISSKNANTATAVARSHGDVLKIVRTLQGASRWRRSEVRDDLKIHFPFCTDTAINDAIDLALRLWLMLNVLDDRQGIHLDQNRAIQWGEEATLQDFAQEQFVQATSSQNQVLDHDFVAVNIVRLSGVEVKWSHSLHDHLSIEHKNGRRLLKIYPFKQWLLFHLRWIERSISKDPSFEWVLRVNYHFCAVTDIHRSIIPRGVLQETLLSLDLLFPHWDPQTDNFLCHRGQSFHQRGPFNDPRPVNVQAFNYWKDRILDLYGIYKSPSVGWAQLWTDRRNPLQWYTFWLAVVILGLTIIFGIISTVTGVMQSYFAYEMLKLARTQVP